MRVVWILAAVVCVVFPVHFLLHDAGSWWAWLWLVAGLFFLGHAANVANGQRISSS